MNNDKDWYIEQLENLIATRLLPVYDLYYKTTGKPRPDLDMPTLVRTKKLPALLRADF